MSCHTKKLKTTRIFNKLVSIDTNLFKIQVFECLLKDTQLCLRMRPENGCFLKGISSDSQLTKVWERWIHICWFPVSRPCQCAANLSARGLCQRGCPSQHRWLVTLENERVDLGHTTVCWLGLSRYPLLLQINISVRTSFGCQPSNVVKISAVHFLSLVFQYFHREDYKEHGLYSDFPSQAQANQEPLDISITRQLRQQDRRASGASHYPWLQYYKVTAHWFIFWALWEAQCHETKQSDFENTLDAPIPLSFCYT